MMKLLRKIVHPFFRRYYNWYHRKPRIYRYKNCETMVYPGLFSPHFTTSTKILLDFISLRDLKNIRMLELGCGCGIISVFAASNGAIVTAIDINPAATKAVAEAAQKNAVKVSVIESDLFQNIDPDNFSLIIINPPFYPGTPVSINEQAWFCGENFEYFEKLFFQLNDRLRSAPEILMILSEDCDICKIKALAEKNGFVLTELVKIKKWNEVNFIFSVKRI